MENKEKVQENIKTLVDKRNELKKSGKLREDKELELLLNKGIIINFLDLADIKNEGIALNLLSILRKSLNSCEELKYEDNKLIGDHRLLECTNRDEIIYASAYSAYGNVRGAVLNENAMTVNKNNTKYTNFFDENGLLTSSDYEIALNSSSMFFENLKIQGKCIYGEQQEVNESLKNINSFEVLKESSSTYGYGQSYQRIFPSMKGIEIDIDVVSYLDEISSDLYKKVELKTMSDSFSEKEIANENVSKNGKIN